MEYNIKCPVGWDGIKFIPTEKDEHLKMIETWDNPKQDHVSVVIYLNKLYSEIPVDDKHPYSGKHYYLKLSLNEAIDFRNALNEHIDRLAKHASI